MTTDSPCPEIQALHARGWSLVPIPFKQKAPNRQGWQHLQLRADELATAFRAPTNVGVLLGAPSGGLIDIDLDSREALIVAARLLPMTALRSGRPSARNSHWYFHVEDPITTTRYRDPLLTRRDARAMLVELRSTGSQTLVPPSVHPCGEHLDWERNGEPARIDAAILDYAVRRVAAASLLARNWPSEGSRHEAALALAGGLLRTGWPQPDVEVFLHATCEAADDAEIPDRLATVRSTAHALTGHRHATGWRHLGEIIDPKIVNVVRDWLQVMNERDATMHPASHEPGMAPVATAPASAPMRKQEPSQATRIVELAYESGISPFRDSDGDPYAIIPIGEHEETWPIRADGFKLHLAQLYYRESDKAPGSQMLVDARNILEGDARFAGPVIPVAVRIAEFAGQLLLDLGDPSWRVVSISRAGWTIREAGDIPVRFRRPKGLQALPLPTQPGDITLLRPLLNLDDPCDFVLVVGWLLGALYPLGARPLLQVLGEQGSAKSSVARVLRGLLDPNLLALRAAPKDEGDLLIAARNNALLAFDNLSSLPRWFSDALCRLATGGGLSKRELYTDVDEVLLDARRPVLLTGISEVATASDLLDRAITVTLPPIPADQRKTERGLQQATKQAQPHILAGILDAAVVGLQRVDDLVLPDPPRMADFVTWVEACAPALDWEPGRFLAALRDNRRRADSVAIESVPIGPALLVLMETTDRWEGTSTELLVRLGGLVPEAVRRERSWPTQANQFSAMLQRVVPNLRPEGIEVRLRRSGGRRLITVERRPFADVELATGIDADNDSCGICGISLGSNRGQCPTCVQHGENP